MIRFDLPALPVRGAGAFQDRGRWLIPTLSILVAVGIGIFMGARPVWRHFRTQRAMALVTRAEELAERKEWDRVGPLLKASLELAPSSVRCFRLAARYHTSRSSPQAFLYWEQILASGTATYAERSAYALLAAELNRPDLCSPVLEQLLRERPSDSNLFRIQMTMARRMNRPSLRAEVAELWLRVSPEEPEAQFELASVRWLSKNEAQQKLAHRLLWGLAYGSNSYSLPAMATLAYGTNLTPSETELLWRRLDSLAPTNRFVAADIRFRLRPEAKPSLVRSLVEGLKPDAPISEVVDTVRWLADHGAIAEALPVMTPERLKLSPSLEMARIQALIEVGRLSEIQAYLNSPPTNAPAYLIHCLRASAAQSAGTPDLVASHLDQAAAAARDDVGSLVIVAQFAEYFGQPRVALGRWRDVAEKFGGGVDAAMQVIRLARAVDDLPSAQPALAALRTKMSTDVGAALLAGYVDGLVGRIRPEVLAQLREIARTNTPIGYTVGVLGLAEWKSGDPVAGLRVMESNGIDWAKAEPRFQTVYAAVLGAAGQREAARLMARRVSTVQLVREERALLEPWLQ